jgi:hypothetical protein
VDSAVREFMQQYYNSEICPDITSSPVLYLRFLQVAFSVKLRASGVSHVEY